MGTRKRGSNPRMGMMGAQYKPSLFTSQNKIAIRFGVTIPAFLVPRGRIRCYKPADWPASMYKCIIDDCHMVWSPGRFPPSLWPSFSGHMRSRSAIICSHWFDWCHAQTRSMSPS